MESDADFTGPVNLGNPAEFSIAELAALVLELTGSASQNRAYAAAAGRSALALADISLAVKRLNWSPFTPLREGLQGTIAYFDRMLSETAKKAVRPHGADGGNGLASFKPTTANAVERDNGLMSSVSQIRGAGPLE